MPKHTEPGDTEAESKEPKVTGKKRIVKWMGDSDVRIILKGDTFDGKLPAGLDHELRWNWENNHCQDVSDLAPEVVDLVLAEPDFIDVTDMKVVPDAAVVKRRVSRPSRTRTTLVTAPAPETPET